MTMNVTFDLKKLAGALAKMQKRPKNERPCSYQDYLQELSRLAGKSSYEAMYATQNTDELPTQAKAEGTLSLANAVNSSGNVQNIGKGQFISVWDSGHTVSTTCLIDLDTMRVLEVEQAEVNDDVCGLFEQHITFNERRYEVLCFPESTAAETGNDRMFAISCFEDFEKAIAPILNAIGQATYFLIDGIPNGYSVNGDWEHELSERFANKDDVTTFAEILDDYTMWFIDVEHNGEHREYYFSAMALLFAQFDQSDSKTLLVQARLDHTIQLLN